MTSVEKRRSGRKSGVHRKHSDGGYSDTSSGGSFLDETDREVSNLTDRAFRSLCIGDEAVYNDSDLCSSSPCNQRDRQLAFSQSGLGRDREDREELKRAAHESFSLRVQQYGQDWIHEGMYGAQVHKDPQWEVYGQQTQGRVSATFQHSFVETSQKGKSLRDEHLSFLSNGATELSLQQHRSRSRVSSLIRVFNSEGHRDGAEVDGNLGEWNDETSWDKSALMSIQRELSEFSYQQHFNNGQFPLAGPFSSRDTNYYSSELASVTNMNSNSSFMRSSHSKHSLSAQLSCNSNFFIHSEYSPFKVWRDHNQFLFKQGEVSGFMHRSEFPKWYETPMYKELSLETHSQDPYTFEERCINNRRNNLAAMVHSTPPRSTSTSTVLQKTLAVEKRCESELASHYPHRKRTQSLGNNRLTSQRPSTASPTTEMSQSVRDTIRSTEALRQKIRMMTEENMATGMMTNQQEGICSNDNFIPFGNTSVAVPPNVVNSKSGITPFNVSQLLTPVVNAHQEAETSEIPQYGVSPQPVEHPPVRAESRGATPDVRMSSYKSRATSLLFNLKDNRKRVKSTYSPTKFKGLDASEKNKQSSVLEPRDTVIDIPDVPDSDNQFSHIEEAIRTNAPQPHYVNQYNSTGSALTTLNPQPATAHTSQNSNYTLKDYKAAQIQGQVFRHSGFTDFTPEIYTGNQLVNGRGLQEDSFAPYKQGMIDNDHAHRLQPSYTATDMQRLNADLSQIRNYAVSEANTEQHFNEKVGREFTKVDRYQQLKDSKHYSNVSSQERWRQTASQDTEKLSLKADVSPWKQEMTVPIEKDRYAQTSQRAAEIKRELNLSRDKYEEENQQSLNNGLEKTELGESFHVAASHKTSGLVNPNTANELPQYASFSNNTVENQGNYRQQQPGAFKDTYVIQTHYGNMEEKEMQETDLTQSYKSNAEQEYRKQHDVCSHTETNMVAQETAQRKHSMQIPTGHEIQSLHSPEPKPLLQHHNNSVSHPDSVSIFVVANQVKDRQLAGVKVEQAPAEHIKAPHAQDELAKAQLWAQVEQPKVESAGLILAGDTSSEKAKAGEAKAEVTRHKRVEEAKVEQIQEEERTREDKTNLREKQEEQARVKMITEEGNNITEEAGAVNLKDEEGGQLKAGQGELERLKQQVKTQGVKREQTGQVRAQQAEQTIRERIKAEQVEREQREAEQVKTEKVKAEKIEAEGKKTEQAKQDQTQEKAKVVDVEKVKVNHMKAEDLRQEKNKEASHGAGQVNAERSTTQTSKPKGENNEIRRREQTKLEQNKLDLGIAELTKTKNMQEKFTKPSAKLTATQHIKMEPDRVEQVKTELAKAKAELAKIKEKMRGEQKEKVRNITSIKEDNITNRDVIININKSNGYNAKDNTMQVHQQREESAPNRNRSDLIDRGADDYERLREKYGFTNAVLTNKNKVSTVENHFLDNADEKPNKGETGNIEKSKHEHSPTNGLSAANTENKAVTESHYVHSESSKKFKLSANYSPAVVDNRANIDTVADKIKDHSDEKSDKCDSVKQTDASQQRDPDLTKPPLLERKPKPVEHSTGSSKDSHFTPARALSHKERVQSKQEILTSKIKAHAEKEISAIKEKGFAGFNSKNLGKQVAGGPSVRQRPASQEACKKQGSTMSSNITPKQQMEPTGIQMAPDRPVSPPSSAVTPITAASSTSQLSDHSQKNVPNEPEKSHQFELEPHTEANQKQVCAVSIDENLLERQKKKKGQHHEENYGKLKEELNDSQALNTNDLTKNNEIPQIAESKQEAALEDSAPSLNLAFGQSEGPVADDSLRIMGITVTVRERKSSLNEIHGDNSTQEQMHAEGREYSNSDTDKGTTASSTSEVFTEKPSMEISTAKTKDPTEQKTDQTNVAMNSHHVQETSTLGMRNNSVSDSITEKMTCIHLDGSSVKLSPQNENQLQEPLSETSGTSPVTVNTKNKDLFEAQPLLYKEDTKTREILMLQNYSAENIKNYEIKSNTEENSPHQRKILDSNENFMAKVVNTTISSNNDSCRDGDETMDKPCGSRNTGGTCGLLPEEKMLHSPPAKQLIKTSPSHNLTQNESIHKSPESQNTGTSIKENNEVDDNVRIDSIAIRVVPAVTGKDNFQTVGKHLTPAVTSNVATANEHKQDATARCKEKVHTSDNKDETEDITQASTEKHMQDSLEDKLGVQYVLSSVRKLSNSLRTSNQQNNLNATSVNSQAEDKKPGRVKKLEDESKIQAMEGDYFQVQGLNETNNSINVGDISDGALKAKDFLGLPPNKTDINSNLYKEERNMLGQSKTVESSTVSVKHENSKMTNSKADYNWDSKQSEGPLEKKSNSETLGVGQANHTESQSITTSRERQRLKYFNPPKENAVKEKYEGRVSTIPEISAIADYARLKVIVSEDRENTVQDIAPNKKEGFFPLIQSHYSRRPVSTVDPKNISEKDESLPNKTDVSAKVNKEPKALVFPITEKEHQRTGMFKLGDKERQDEMPLDVKSNEQHAQHLTEINTSPTAQTEHVAGTATQRTSHTDQSIHQPRNHTLQKMSSSAVKTTKSAYEGLTSLNKNSYSQSTLGQMHIVEENVTTPKNDERAKNLTKDGMVDKLREASHSTLQETIKAKQQTRANQWEEESPTSLAKDDKRSAQRKEDRRAIEGKAVAITIQEGRETLRQSERIAEVERKIKQTEKQRAALQLREKQTEEERRRKEDGESRAKIVEERKTKLEGQKETIKEHNERKRLKQQEEERTAQEEQQRRTAQEEQQRRPAEDEQKTTAAQLDHHRRTAQEEQHRRSAQEEQQRRISQEEQQRRQAQEEQQKIVSQEEQQRRPAEDKQKTTAAQLEHHRRTAQEEQHRRSAQEEQQRRISQEEQQRRIAQVEQEKNAAHEEQKWPAALTDEQMRARQTEEKILADIEEQKKRKQRELQAARISEEERIKHIQGQNRAERQIEEYMRERQKKEERMRTQREEEGKTEQEKTIAQQRAQKQADEEGRSLCGQSHAALKEEEKKITQDQMSAQRVDEVRVKRREGEIKLEAHKEMKRGPEMEEQKTASQKMDALQYYAITSTESERTPRGRQQRNNPPEDPGSHSGLYRPHAAASPALSLPRSNTSSPALGDKPSMFRVKDNTIRGSSLTKSVKPHFHKTFGDDFRVGSPMERVLERGDEGQEINRRSSVTPIHLDTGSSRLATIKESSTFHPASSSQDYSASLPQHRPYSRRSIALDEDDSRSVISNMSEDAESFASCATDMSNARGVYDSDRPESACSFSSDVSRSLGKPPAVPPKSEKALQRAKRLTSRRIKKELSKAAPNRISGTEKPPQEMSSVALSSSAEVDSSKHHAVASPHFSPPVSLAHAPTLGSSLPLLHTGRQSSHPSVHVSRHATGPISLPAVLPHSTAPVTLTVASPHTTSFASHTANTKTVAHIPTSPTIYHVNHPAPVTKYHVESSYPQAYPLTQRKVLQDLGSGQYYVVDVPVQIKTKTFFDPETGKYVQLNVRESGQSTSRPQPQQTYPQPHLQPQMQPQQHTFSQASPAGKPYILYQGYHGYPQNYQPVSSMPSHGSAVTPHQDQQPVRENHSCTYQAPEMAPLQNSEGHCYSPEKAPYMDTVCDTEKTFNRVYNTQSFPECEANSQLAESSACENDNAAHSRCQPCDIITMSELEDFMDVSDW